MKTPNFKAVVVLTTWPADRDAETFAHALIKDGLAACVNVLPEMRSIYRWRGTVEAAGERQLVIKTAASRVDALRDRVSQLHPYEVPEFLVIAVSEGSERYLGWIGESTQG